MAGIVIAGAVFVPVAMWLLEDSTSADKVLGILFGLVMLSCAALLRWMERRQLMREGYGEIITRHLRKRAVEVLEELEEDQ